MNIKIIYGNERNQFQSVSQLAFSSAGQHSAFNKSYPNLWHFVTDFFTQSKLIVFLSPA